MAKRRSPQDGVTMAKRRSPQGRQQFVMQAPRGDSGWFEANAGKVIVSLIIAAIGGGWLRLESNSTEQRVVAEKLVAIKAELSEVKTTLAQTNDDRYKRSDATRDLEIVHSRLNEQGKEIQSLRERLNGMAPVTSGR